MSQIETLGGVPTRGEAYSKLMHHLREAQSQAAILSHLHSTEDSEMDKLLAKGWMGVSEMLKLVAYQITQMAMRKMQ